MTGDPPSHGTACTTLSGFKEIAESCGQCCRRDASSTSHLMPSAPRGVRGTGATDRDEGRKESNSEEDHRDLKIRPDVTRIISNASPNRSGAAIEGRDDTDAKAKKPGAAPGAASRASTHDGLRRAPNGSPARTAHARRKRRDAVDTDRAQDERDVAKGLGAGERWPVVSRAMPATATQGCGRCSPPHSIRPGDGRRTSHRRRLIAPSANDPKHARAR